MTDAREFLDGRRVTVKIDRQLGTKHPKWGFEYPVNYGFIPRTMSGDGEELDAYVLGVDEPLAKFEGLVIGMIHRTNDNDDKLLVTDGRVFTETEVRELTAFQEQYFESEVIFKQG